MKVQKEKNNVEVNEVCECVQDSYNEREEQVQEEKLMEVDENEIGQIISQFDSAGIFNPTRGMGEVMKGENGGSFYAGLLQEEGGKKNRIQVVIEYPDGTYSDKLYFAQGEFLLAAGENFNQAKYQKAKPKFQYKKFVNRFSKVLMDYKTPDMEIYPETLLKVIYEKYMFLPVKTLPVNLTIKEIYKEIYYYVMDNFQHCEYMMHKDFYRLTREDIVNISRYFGMKEMELLMKLVEFDLLYKTEGAKGLQTRISVKGEKIYTYNIYKNIEDSLITNSQENNCIPNEFSREYLLPSERARVELKKREAEYIKLMDMSVDDWSEMWFDKEWGAQARAFGRPLLSEIRKNKTKESSKSFNESLRNDMSSKSSNELPKKA